MKTGYKQTQEHQDKLRKANIGKHSGERNGMFGRKGKLSANWISEEYQGKNGRWFIWVDGIKYLRARYVAMQYLKRELLSEEIVHHINEDKGDDRPENLYLFSTRGKHIGFHNLKIKPILTSNLTV